MSQCGLKVVQNPKKMNISHDFFCIELKLSTVVVPWYFHCDISMATQWAPGSLLEEVLFTHVVHSVAVSEYGHYTAEAQESLLNSGETSKAVFILGR